MDNHGFKVMVENYCEGCCEFDPMYADWGHYADGNAYITERVIMCKNRDKCSHLYSHLKIYLAAADMNDEEVQKWIL